MENKIESVVAIEKECFPKDCWTEQGIKDSLDSPSCKKYFIGEDGEILGYMFCNVSSYEAEILKIAIKKNRQSKGLGTVLLKQGLDDLKGSGVTQVFLDVRESNIPAKKLYEKVGFNVIGKRKNYYYNPVEDGIVMKKEL